MTTQVSDKLRTIQVTQKPKNSSKVAAQQEYYNRLTKTGIAKKQTYNLRAVSAI